jgi:hypothetical protein
MMLFRPSHLSLFLSLVLVCSVAAFAPTGTRTTTSLVVPRTKSVALQAKDGQEQPPPKQELFKAGLLANVEAEAAQLVARKKVRTVKDLGWKQPLAKRRGNARPRHWAFGGAGEKAVQDKPNYDPTSPMCVESWLSLPDVYTLLQDDTAVADTIFVALAGGGAFVERQVAEEVLQKWWPNTSKNKNSFDEAAFLKSVQQGRQQFLLGWAGFVGFTSFALIGIVAPTNPVQMALVNGLEALLHNDAKIAEAVAAAAGSILM